MRYLLALCTLSVCMGQQQLVVSLRTLSEQVNAKSQPIVNKAYRAYEKGNRAECKRLLEQALTTDPESSRALTAAGALAVEEREFDRAAELFQRAANLNGTDPELLSFAAVASGLVMDLDAAIRYSESSLRYDPANLRSNYVLGISLATKSRRLPEAARNLEKTVDRFPEARLFLSWVYARLGDREKATATCQRYLGNAAEPLDTCIQAATQPQNLTTR